MMASSFLRIVQHTQESDAFSAFFKKHKLFQALHNLLCLLLANKGHVRQENQGTVDMDL